MHRTKGGALWIILNADASTWKFTIMISFDYGNTHVTKECVNKFPSTYTIPKYIRSKIHIFIPRKDETNHPDNIADYNYFAFDEIYIYTHIGEIERVNRPFNFQNTSLRPRLQINRPMVKRARIGIYRIQSSLRNEILLHPNPSALVAGEKERIRRKTFVPRLARIDPSFHRSRVFVALIYPLASTVSFFPFSFLPFFLYTYIHAIAWFKLYSPTNRSTH